MTSAGGGIMDKETTMWVEYLSSPFESTKVIPKRTRSFKITGGDDGRPNEPEIPRTSNV